MIAGKWEYSAIFQLPCGRRVNLSILLWKAEAGLMRVCGNRFWLSRRKNFQIITTVQWQKKKKTISLHCELPVTGNSQAMAGCVSVMNSEGSQHWTRAQGGWALRSLLTLIVYDLSEHECQGCLWHARGTFSTLGSDSDQLCDLQLRN